MTYHRSIVEPKPADASVVPAARECPEKGRARRLRLPSMPISEPFVERVCADLAARLSQRGERVAPAACVRAVADGLSLHRAEPNGPLLGRRWDVDAAFWSLAGRGACEARVAFGTLKALSAAHPALSSAVRDAAVRSMSKRPVRSMRVDARDAAAAQAVAIHDAPITLGKRMPMRPRLSIRPVRGSTTGRAGDAGRGGAE